MHDFLLVFSVLLAVIDAFGLAQRVETAIDEFRESYLQTLSTAQNKVVTWLGDVVKFVWKAALLLALLIFLAAGIHGEETAKYMLATAFQFEDPNSPFEGFLTAAFRIVLWVTILPVVLGLITVLLTVPLWIVLYVFGWIMRLLDYPPRGSFASLCLIASIQDVFVRIWAYIGFS
jgi:hypothetical protein